MFEAILAKSAPKRPFALGVASAAAVHVGLIGLAMAMSGNVRKGARPVRDLVVTFLDVAPLEPRPDGAAHPAGHLANNRPAAKTMRSMPRPKLAPSSKEPLIPPLAPSPEPAAPHAAAIDTIATSNGTGANTSASGSANAGDGVLSGNGASGSGSPSNRAAAGPTAPEATLTFGEGMTRPALLSKVDPTYTREALAAKIEGVMLVQCVITRDGALERCRIRKGLAHMNDAVLAVLPKWRYTPVTFQGRAIDVDYIVPVRLVLPR